MENGNVKTMKTKLIISFLTITLLAVSLASNVNAKEADIQSDCSRLMKKETHEHKGKTFYNTTGKHVSPFVRYFKKIKKKFQKKFKPVTALKKLPIAKLEKLENICAVAGVSVDQRGKLTDLVMLSSSNYKPYDEEVMRTVKKAAPFSRPPKKLLGEDKFIHMAWTFVVYY